LFVIVYVRGKQTHVEPVHVAVDVVSVPPALLYPVAHVPLYVHVLLDTLKEHDDTPVPLVHDAHWDHIAVNVIVAPFSVVTFFKLPPAAIVLTLGVHAVVPSDFLHVTDHPPNVLLVFTNVPWAPAVHVPLYEQVWSDGTVPPVLLFPAYFTVH
jgi:hypothetical protein